MHVSFTPPTPDAVWPIAVFLQNWPFLGVAEPFAFATSVVEPAFVVLAAVDILVVTAVVAVEDFLGAVVTGTAAAGAFAVAVAFVVGGAFVVGALVVDTFAVVAFVVPGAFVVRALVVVTFEAAWAPVAARIGMVLITMAHVKRRVRVLKDAFRCAGEPLGWAGSDVATRFSCMGVSHFG